ncbi:DNA-binding core protein [Eastern grey kangaroopox virus]|uniref:DNA-binding core protein n=1 Tax=Eastern grey kangaroopox virus TaxID=2042482 RepID=A0A2C9DT18_9POXV|nr:DNA-binding core protein [Eastern grey kangaroopox virus]ATI21151.1 DNA-binding core protein [Eastern grey kangaroopox virus]ATX75058.1 DNA-binding core protein [Eastern grey kangaroopox virus]
MEAGEQLVLNSINAKALKAYLTARISDIVDELVAKKTTAKKKAQAKKPEAKIPLDLINPCFVERFGLGGYKDGVLNSLITSLVENNYFENGKLKRGDHRELVLLDVEKEILARVDPCSALNIDVGDVKTLANRLRVNANCFEFRGHVYHLEQNRTEDIINQLIRHAAISLDTKNSIKDSFYTISDELMEVFKTRLFRCPQVKDNVISRTRLYDYLTRMTKPDDSRIYVILRDQRIANILDIETVLVEPFTYTKYTLLVAAIANNVDKYSKRFNDSFYDSIAEYVKDNEKINIAKVVDYLTISTVKLDNLIE